VQFAHVRAAAVNTFEAFGNDFEALLQSDDWHLVLTKGRRDLVSPVDAPIIAIRQFALKSRNSRL
jgi:hypothetical protein